MSDVFLTREEIEHPYANLSVMLEDKRKKAEQMSKTVFAQITASPEVLAPRLVFRAEYKTIKPMYLEGKGGIIVGEVWKSTVIAGASFKTETEAIAATLAELKEAASE